MICRNCRETIDTSQCLPVCSQSICSYSTLSPSHGPGQILHCRGIFRPVTRNLQLHPASRNFRDAAHLCRHMVAGSLLDENTIGRSSSYWVHRRVISGEIGIYKMPLPMKGMLIAFLALNTSLSHHLPLLTAGLSCLIEKGIDLKHPDTASSHVSLPTQLTFHSTTHSTQQTYSFSRESFLMATCTKNHIGVDTGQEQPSAGGGPRGSGHHKQPATPIR